MDAATRARLQDLANRHVATQHVWLKAGELAELLAAARRRKGMTAQTKLLALADALAAAWLIYKDAQIAWDNLPKASSPVEIRIETATRLTWATERMDAAHDAFLAARRQSAHGAESAQEGP